VSARAPEIDDIVTVPHAVGEWLVIEIGRFGDLGLRGARGAYLAEAAERVTFVRAASLADKELFMTAEEKIRRGFP